MDESDSSAIAGSLGVSASCDSFCDSQCCRHPDCVMEFFSGVSSHFFLVPSRQCNNIVSERISASNVKGQETVMTNLHEGSNVHLIALLHHQKNDNPRFITSITILQI
jgi:hypothetical protein